MRHKLTMIWYWFMYWLDDQQVTTWANVHKELGRHMASIGPDKLRRGLGDLFFAFETQVDDVILCHIDLGDKHIT